MYIDERVIILPQNRASVNEDSVKSSERGIDNRRQVLKYMAAGAVTFAAGCSTNEGSSEESTGGGSSGAEETDSVEEKSGGHVRVTGSVFGQTLDPLRYTGGYQATLLCMSGLTKLSASLEAEPDLATDWSANDDATVWTFQLREDATFNHNGETVTADDVEATFNTIYDEDSPGTGSIGPVESVEATGEFEVEFTLERAFADFPKTLTSQWALILPREVLEDEELREQLDNQIFGSGPFELEEYVVDDRAVLTASDDFYETDEEGNQLPHVDRATYQVIPEDSAKVTALENQEVDILDVVPPAQYDRVQNIDSAEVSETPSGEHFPIVMDSSTAPFDDQRVIQAMKYATDREAMLEGAGQGLGTTAQDTPIAPTHEFHTELEDKWGDTAQLEQARELMDEAGYSDGLEIDAPLYAPSEQSPQIGPTAVLFQEQMAEIGIEFEIQEVTWDNYLTDIETSAPWYVSIFSLRPAELQILGLLFREGAAFNGFYMSDGLPDAHDQLISDMDAAAAATDPEERQELFTSIQQNIHDNSTMIVPFFTSQMVATNDYVREFENNPTGYRLNLDETYLTSDAPTK